MNRLILIVLIVIWVSAVTEPVHACQCREYGTPVCARFWRSDAVFFGQVIDIKPLKKKPDDIYTYVMVSFRVQESFRGVSGNRVQVATATTMCDTVFKKGKPYLVFATHDDETGQLFTGMCTGTGLAVETDEILSDLRKLANGEAGESISGRIKSSLYQGLPGIKIEIISKDKTFETMSTKYGEFLFSLPGPGFFTVRVSVPYATRLMDSSNDVTVRSTPGKSVSIFEYDVALGKSQCDYLELWVDGTDPRATATVTGNVLTATAQGVDRGAVFLINGVEAGPDYVAILQKDGSFRFENVMPGEYELVLNAKDEVPGEWDAPYARTYYPATEEKGAAKKIQVAEGARIENLTMRVGQRMSERTVTGTVVWKNGHSVEHTYLAVYSGDEYVRRVEINDDGTFKFTLYGDFVYSVEALDFIDEIEGRSQRVKIPPENPTPLKLVIQRIKR
jgi:hypothetical protein